MYNNIIDMCHSCGAPESACICEEDETLHIDASTITLVDILNLDLTGEESEAVLRLRDDLSFEHRTEV